MRVLNKMLRRILRVYYSISTQGLHTEQVKRLTTEKLLSLSKKNVSLHFPENDQMFS